MKEITMKSSSLLSRSVIAAGLAVGILGYLAPTATFADGKAASLLMPAKATVSAAQPQPAAAGQTAMSCKDGFAKVTDAGAKGMRIGSVKSVPVHLCNSCSTKITSVSSGKARTDRSAHTCGDSASAQASCCMASK